MRSRRGIREGQRRMRYWRLSRRPTAPSMIPPPSCRENSRAGCAHVTLELQDVESGVVVGEIHHALRIDKAVAGLDDLRPVGTRVKHALRIGRHEEPGLA